MATLPDGTRPVTVHLGFLSRPWHNNGPTMTSPMRAVSTQCMVLALQEDADALVPAASEPVPGLQPLEDLVRSGVRRASA